MNSSEPAFNITFEDFKEFLTRKGLSTTCSECKTNKPNLLTHKNEEGTDIINVIENPIINAPNNVAYNYASIQCSNCHHVRHFNAISVAKDIIVNKEKKKEKKDEK